MVNKINRKQNFQFSIFPYRINNFQSIFKFPIFIVFLLLIYTRFINIGWGLPYPMHPDERNMSVALQQLRCDEISNCFSPHFFAYGQFPLYLGYLLIVFYKFLIGAFGSSISFIEATLSLRIISAIASVINVYVLYKIIFNFSLQDKQFSIFIKNFKFRISNLLILIFVPYTIQFAHFGTTESLLMLFYSLIIYLSLKLIDESISKKKFVFLSSLFSGLAVATKVSSLIFLVIPVIGFISKIKDQRSKTRLKVQKFLIFGLGFGICTLIFALVFSPHNLISWKDFVSTIKYESAVGMGKILVFYTRQFTETIPVLFQLEKIFPYVLGWPLYILFIIGFIFLSWKDKKINLLRLFFLIYFIANAFLYAKWTRFMAPILPLMIVISTLFFIQISSFFFILVRSKIKDQRSEIKLIVQRLLIFGLGFGFCSLVFVLIIPGIAYLSVYHRQDVRFQASEWIYKNIPNNSVILSETANVVDLPLEVENYKVHKVYKVINFNFYNLDEKPELQKELKEHLKKADFIIIPSRRIFMNHACKNFQFSIFPYRINNFQSIFNKKCQILKKKYPLTNEYYEKLFDGRLGFKQVAEFNSSLLSDEQAEETFTVFDHPVIRIYTRK